MGEFDSDDRYIYYCGKESLRRNGVAIMVNKRIRNAVLGCNLRLPAQVGCMRQALGPGALGGPGGSGWGGRWDRDGEDM